MYNILYVHGYGGHENGSSSQLIKKMLIDRGIDVNIYAPHISLDNPEKALKEIRDASSGMDLVIASSMGALLSMMSTDNRKLLINPAFPKDIEAIDSNYSKDNLNFLQKKLDILLNNIDYEDKFFMYFLFGEKDTVAKNFDVIASRYMSSHIFKCDFGHSIDESVGDTIANIVKTIIEDKKYKFTFYPYIDAQEFGLKFKRHSVLNEHYVNLWGDDLEEKKKYLDEVWDLVTKSYAKIGGPHKEKEELLEKKYFWKLVRKNNKIIEISDTDKVP